MWLLTGAEDWWSGWAQYKYSRLGGEARGPALRDRKRSFNLKRMVLLSVTLIGCAWLLLTSVSTALPPYGSGKGPQSCDTIHEGYICRPSISHFWGQYSPYFTVPSSIPADLPDQCEITFVNILSRHGARDPTASKTAVYNQTIQQLKANVSSYSGKYAFLADYEYTLGADQLTLFGQQEMINSGIEFYDRYERLASYLTPFVRASGEARVVESAYNWTQGYHAAKLADKRSRGDSGYPYSILTIPEGSGENNTLSHEICTAFEDDYYGDTGGSATAIWANIFLPPIQARLNTDLPGANLTQTQTLYMMDLCPFNTVASANGSVSPFCNLFTEHEWHQYNYYETLDKYYGYSYGNLLGPTQGVGFAHELIARMTDQPVDIAASINATLDTNAATFPLHRKLYADFSHDNDMTGIFAALGLYNGTAPLSNTTITEASQSGGYSAAWTVPFAARAYFEKMRCRGYGEELVRVVVNGRVQSLEHCGADRLGRCKLSAWIESLGFARSDGLWDKCFA